MSLDDNAKIIWDDFIAHGLSENQTAGILGNISQESGFDPTSVNPRSGAYGIIQWFDVRKDRMPPEAANGDLRAQLDYFWQEVENDPYESAQFQKFLNYGDTSVEGYAYAYQIYCERGDASEAEYATRYKEANRVLALFTGTSGGGVAQAPQEDDGYSYDELDMSNLVSNHPENPEITRLTGFQPQTIHGLNKISDYIASTYKIATVISGGTEEGYHAQGTYSHENGWKADLVINGVTPDNDAGKSFKEFCNENGWSANYEGNHWDIDFSGNDSRDPQANKQKGFTGNGFAYLVGQMPSGVTNHFYEQNQDPTWNDYEGPSQKLSFWDVLSSNFMDSFTSTGVAQVAQMLWGNLAHSSNHAFGMDPVTQEDIDYVKNALPNDKDAQRFVLLNGRDSEEIKWLVNQKLVDKERRAKVEQWRASNEWGLQKAMTYVAGAAGTMLDPMMLIPVGGEINALKIAGRVGEAVMNINKAKDVAIYAAEMGAKMASVTTADDYLKEQFGGEKQDYGWDAALSFLGGSVFGALGGFAKTRSGTTTRRIVEKADHTETKALLHSADVDTSKAATETIEDAMKLHDPEYRTQVKSKAYEALEDNQRVVATTYEKARKLVQDASGIKIPETAKAIYVPNEDYTFLLTDRIKPAEVDRLLSHEFGVHAGLKKTIGDKAYTKLMESVSKQSEKEGTAFFEARAKAGSYDPEEIFAQMVEDGTLPDTMWSKVKGAFHRVLKKEGYNAHFSRDQIKDIMMKQVQEQRNPEVFHTNPDGTTAFAGLQYSKSNLLNPTTMANFYHLEQEVTKETQRDLKAGVLTKPLRWVAKHLENGVLGMGVNSVSNTIRKYTPLIWEDARGRGLGHVQTITAETNKQRLTQLLTAPYIKYMDARQRWTLAHKKMGHAANMAFDKLVYSAYNEKYAGNVANAIKDIPKEVSEAVEHLHDLRKLQIELGKRSATDVGSKAKNLIDKDWYEVDEELWRITDTERRMQFIVGNFIDQHGGKTALQQAKDFFETYYRKFAKRGVIEEKIIRDIRMENAKITEANNRMAKRMANNPNWKPKPLIPEVVTAQDIDEWLDKHVPEAVDYLLNGVFDPADARNLSNLGSLSFLKQRIPIDTTGILKLPNSNKEFSFDNDLRTFDMDNIVLKNINRFAGEASLLNVFGSEKGLQSFFKKAEEELNASIGHGMSNKDVLNELNQLKKSIAEFRGVRPQDETAIGKLGAIARILKNFSYAKNGANMGFNQFGELGGAMAYGGVSQVFRIFPPIGKFMEDVKYGKVTAQTLRDAEDYAFGASMESQIFTANWGDRVVRDALTDKDDLVNKALIKVADMTANLGKVTSAINMLPKMTDSMVRGMRISTMMDSIRYAYGDSMSRLRNPFTEAKLKAAHVSQSDWRKIQGDLVKYTTHGYNDSIIGFDIQKWQKEDMNSFLKWYNLIQLQTERAIVSGTRQGNKNLLKNMNSVTQLLFQFKDYTLRAINGQTMRAMTAKDMDDAIATMASIVTNTAVYAARAGLTYAAYKGAGLDQKAEEYKNYMFNDGNLARAIAFRSAILGSPLSFGNDMYEIATGAPTIRTTVDRTNKKAQSFKERTAGDVGGDLVSQIPAISAGVDPMIQMYHAFSHATDDKTTQKDFKNVLKLLPIPNFIPLTVMQQYLVEQSGYPEKKPKK